MLTINHVAVYMYNNIILYTHIYMYVLYTCESESHVLALVHAYDVTGALHCIKILSTAYAEVMMCNQESRLVN